MQKQCCYIILLFSLIHLSVFSQYSISGYTGAKENNKTVYLSQLRYNEENAIYPEQVLTSTQADSTGYFKITGTLLPNENMLYRIHSNRNENTSLFDFIESGTDKNYHNFIFSNNDTMYFPKGRNVWFSHAQNTNLEDKEWRNAIKYELKLLEEYSKTKNTDAIVQAEKKFLREYKSYCTGSLTGSLVKLIGFAHLRRTVSLAQDFKTNPDFYCNLLDELNLYYSGAYYFSQFQKEFSNLSASIFHQKYVFHKRLNYFFGIVILFLFVVLLYLLRKLRVKIKQEIKQELSTLTAQEEKVTKLICEGKSNKEIASLLFVSLSTVKSHIGNINSKLNVTNRKQLVDKLKNHTQD